MDKFDWQDPLVLFLGFMLIMAAMVGIGAFFDSIQQADNMRVCVEAGKEWVQNDSGNFECR